MTTDNVGAIQIDVPRDRNGTFEPQLVKKRQRRLSDMDQMVLSRFAKGLTTGEIAAHFAEMYGTSVSKDTISRITDRVLDEMNGWMSRPLEPIYAAVFIDAIVIKVRDGQVRNQPYYAAIGVDLEGHKDILGIWPGNGDGESAKLWFACLTELKNRGVKDVFFMVCDGLKGLPDSIGAVFPAARVQTSSVQHGGGQRFWLVTCAAAVTTSADEPPSRSTGRPVRQQRGRPGMTGQREQHFECRDEVPGCRGLPRTRRRVIVIDRSQPCHCCHHRRCSLGSTGGEASTKSASSTTAAPPSPGDVYPTTGTDSKNSISC